MFGLGSADVSNVATTSYRKDHYKLVIEFHRAGLVKTMELLRAFYGDESFLYVAASPLTSSGTFE